MATPVNVKRWKAEYAKSSRSSCKTCKIPIDKEKLRLGKMGQATQFDGYMPMWNHASCILKKANQIKCLDDVEGIDSLRWEDQQKIRKYIETGVSSSSTAGGYVDECVEVSQTSRATCKLCNQKIMKGEVRISTKPEVQSARGLAWHHASCFMKSSPSTQVEKLSGWESLSPSDQEVVRSSVREGVSTTKRFSNLGARVDNSCVGGTKRKSTTSGGPKSKLPKPEESISVDDEPTGEGTNAPDLESRLEAQSKRLWAIKDELKKHVTTADLKEMLKANHQYSSGSEFDLHDHCADGMLFGALGPCPMCKGPLCCSGGQYRCRGFFSEWNKCSYMTTEASRLKRKWKIPADTSNEYLNKWFKSQKGEKPVRLLPPSSFKNASGSQNSNDTSNTKSENLEDLKVAITGLPKKSMEDWKCKIESVGGTVHAKIKKDTTCLVISGSAVDDQDPEIRKARRMKVPIVRDGYLGDCIERKKMLPFEPYKVEAVSDTPIRMVTVNVQGRIVVHESSGLQDSGHILEDGKSIYNTTLSMSDLTTGVNSYYILQIIKDDKGSDCSVFRKWGRIGNDKIGGTKLEEMSKSDAIVEFKRLFLQNTGNYWESWVQKKNFQKQPGKFFPLDIDYGKNIPPNATGLLAPPLIELMKMLSNIETYRAAMMEFEINMSEMPLGMLSKSNIQKGFEALTVIQNLLASDRDPSIRENMLKEASSQFFTLIPSIHPHIIRDEDDFKSKVKMLDALQDIEIASRLVGFDVGSDDSLDENYKKLRCDITPLPHDSEDFLLVKNYLQTTHAPTHTAWNLELEDVFALERQGELDQYTPYRNKLQNKMLLWHGSHLTNFVSILSQGLRIPLPEAPATGYMFGKGVYFADMVSKSAQYCRADKKNPVGLMLLSEVALGQMHELKKATCMDKPPKGKHSTKGLGKTIPQPSEYVKWRDEVVVPSGKPVPSNVKLSELLYNEFVIYDNAQIKMQFLLKVRFHHKIEREDKQGPPALVSYPPRRGRRGASYRRFGGPSR